MKDDLPEITPSLLLQAYASASSRWPRPPATSEIFRVDPQRRGVLPLDGFHVSRRLARSFSATTVRDPHRHAPSPAVVAACADRPETWINADDPAPLRRAAPPRPRPHRRDLAGRRAGRRPLRRGARRRPSSARACSPAQRDASKVALVALVARLIAGGFRLLDTQFVTDHLTRLGAIEISRAAYHRLRRCRRCPGRRASARCATTPAVSRCCSSPPRRRSADGRAPTALATTRTSNPRSAGLSSRTSRISRKAKASAFGIRRAEPGRFRRGSRDGRSGWFLRRAP